MAFIEKHIDGIVAGRGYGYVRRAVAVEVAHRDIDRSEAQRNASDYLEAAGVARKLQRK